MTTEKQLEKATFAGGCFWCMVKPFDQFPGIHKVVSGYTGGHKQNPTYEEVKKGTTGHREAIEITYDPTLFPYKDLLAIFWRTIDPTDAGGQFIDRGEQYKTAIYYHSEEQRVQAEETKEQLESSNIFVQPVVTDIFPATTFYPAEEYHQDFYKKNPLKYKKEVQESGRQAFLETNWYGTKE
ncbi:peptide-methionine (S)-S-oxide reductase MsrA [Evansella tamaricis]|uniref:Peptide methionine sulfoxide reductase MsrA n=1 Tax=Evansella tamaricis TaxID=2069301 RepID=A0ABS6JF62_9BACI|nr:peptide-methionine (S)-S-oxide reductase MsrA [Evansella tamaricis]MBU9712281.1 peptide-methionine (S)-S-oxide reductase MsrA [Evansella tamaricis]